MNKNFEPLTRTLRIAAAGAMVFMLIAYYIVKFNRTPAFYPQADLSAACQSVAGCKNASIKRAFDTKTGTWAIKLTVVADRKAKSSPIEETMNKTLDGRWNDQNSWSLAGWKDHTTEVRYE